MESQAKTCRQAGGVMLVLGIAVAIAAWLSWDIVGRTLIIAVATPMALIPAGIYMMMTGKNPFVHLKR